MLSSTKCCFHLVMVFSKSTCPFCMRAKATIKEHGHDFHAVELDQLAEGKEMQASLLELTGQRTGVRNNTLCLSGLLP